MTITLYKNSAEKNRVDKTNYLSNSRVLTGTLREECDVLTPVIIIQTETYPNYNYCYITEFNRYYFIEGIASVNTNMWEITMAVDVLMTYRSAIYELDCFVDRNENVHNKEIIDNKRIIEQGVDITKYEVNSYLLDGDLFDKTKSQFVVSGLSLSIV